MRSQSADAAAKLILLGEHAVVYGHAALAIPLGQPRAMAVVSRAAAGRPVSVELPDLGLRWDGTAPVPRDAETFARVIRAAAERFPAVPREGWKLTVRSQIPFGCGLGSGSAVAAASFRAIGRFFRVPISPPLLSKMVFAIEKLHHGNPSGIDNTVVAIGRPILFRKGRAPRFLAAPRSPCLMVIGHTGVKHRTSEIVAAVSRARGKDPARYAALFRDIGRLSGQGAKAFQASRWQELGRLMDRNQELLEDIGVSSPKLGTLIRAARKAGALGAKLTGAGRGGCMTALCADAAVARRTARALKAAGAAVIFITEVSRNGKA